MNWTAVVVNNVKNRLGNEHSKSNSQLSTLSDPKENLPVSELRFDEITDTTSNQNKHVIASTSATGLNLNQSNEWPSQNQHDAREGVLDSQPANDASINLKVELLKGSFEEMCQKMDKIEKNIASQKIDEIEKNIALQLKKGIEENQKQIKESFMLQHREAKRRLARLEKNTNSGKFI